MMKKMILTAVAALTLAGCANLTSTLPPTPKLSAGTITIHTEPEGAAILRTAGSGPGDDLFSENWQLVH
jgi:hypothetical protein